MRLNRHHLSPDTSVLIARRQKRVLGTLSLVLNGRVGLPMHIVFSEEIEALMRSGARVAEATSFAISESSTASLHIVDRLMGLAAQRARHVGVSHLLVAVHPRHAGFYRRRAGFRYFAATRAYPSVEGRPATGLALNLATLEWDAPEVYRRYFDMRFPLSYLEAEGGCGQLRRELADHWLRLQACDAGGV
jgi:hypothetical protein